MSTKRKTWTHEQVLNWLEEVHPDIYAFYESEGFPRWIPLPKELRPASKPPVEVKSSCTYCKFHSSSRSCPIHGWAEKYKDGNRNRVRTPEEIAAEVLEPKQRAAKKHPVVTNKLTASVPVNHKVTTGSRLIPEEIQDCRNYLQVLFPAWEKETFRRDKMPQIRAAALAVGYSPKTVQLAMRDPHYFYAGSKSVYP